MDFYYLCSECEKAIEITDKAMVCPQCSKKQQKHDPLRGVLEVKLEGSATADFQIEDLLPVEKKFFPSIPVGQTPLWKPENLRNKFHSPHLYLKDDTLNPSGSLKDRASFLVGAFAKKMGVENIVVASTGNAASSMSAIGAAAGLKVTIFIPKTAPKAKMVQSLQYGARVILVDGNYDKAYELSLEYSKAKNALNRNTAFNPLTIEGKKTAALEIYKQLQKVPDYIFLPVGDGVILCGIYKGFRDLKELGLTHKIPTLYAIQAQGSNAICRAFHGGKFSSQTSKTIADSICVDVPRGGWLALKNLRAHKGMCLTVSDEKILAAQKELSSSAGLFAEPAGAAAFAGFLSARDSLPPEATTVILITGNGLKDLSSAMKEIKCPGKSISSLEEISQD